MLKLVRRLLASAAAGIALHPSSQAAPPSAPVVMAGVDIASAEQEAQRIENNPMYAQGVRAEYLAAYDGPKTVLSEDLLRAVRSSKRFSNTAVDPVGARMELDKFIQERTR